MATNIEIIQKACVLVGIAPITGFTDGTTEAIVAEQLYEDTISSALSMHPWSFATKLVDVTANRISTDPIATWDARYQLPIDQAFLTVHQVLVDDYGVDYDRFEDDIYVNASENSTVIVKVGYRANENDWPSYFRLWAIFRIALMLAIGVTRKEEIIQKIMELEDQELARAKNRDSQSRTAKKANLKRFRNRRF